jgi:TetR/AcrR family transcriptional regulator, fatty acid biosynthesis regulator
MVKKSSATKMPNNGTIRNAVNKDRNKVKRKVAVRVKRNAASADLPDLPSVPPPKRVRLAPEERAGQILDFAARLILEEGFTEVSMERLGREAGISKALIYNYFPNRNDLLRALLEREIDVLRDRQMGQVRDAKDFRDLVLRTTRIYIQQVKERGPLLQRLWAEPAVARSVADKNLNRRDEAMSFFARRVSKEYGLPEDVALSAVDMQMAMTEAAAQHLPRSHGDVDFATNICVTLLLGGLEALALAHRA